MKKITLVLTLALALASTASAQKFKFGIKGGLNFPSTSAFGFEDDVDANSSGYHAGLFASFRIAMFAVQPEVLYDFTKFEAPDLANFESKVSYVQIPLMVKFYPIPVLNLQVGPRFGVLVDEATDSDLGDGEEFLKSSDISIAFGLGADLPFGLDIHARYNLGLSDNNDFSGGSESNNSNFQISLGYALFKKGL